MARLVELDGREVALIFPGQGSQSVGMGRELYEGSAAARAVFEQADRVLDLDTPLSRLCFQGPEERLKDTEYTQPAILTISIAYLKALQERLDRLNIDVEPVYCAGHSLGQYSAMVAAEAMDFVTALNLVRRRGRLMKESGDRRPGGMAAVVGLKTRQLLDICRRASRRGIINLATENTPNQSVISGEIDALMEAVRMAKQAGARRVVRLGISIASHSPLMEEAAARLKEALANVRLQAPRIPVVSNVTAGIMRAASDVRQELARQTCSRVLWSQSVAQMIQHGVDTFVELGPGRVLSGTVRRIDDSVDAIPARRLDLVTGDSDS